MKIIDKIFDKLLNLFPSTLFWLVVELAIIFVLYITVVFFSALN